MVFAYTPEECAQLKHRDITGLNWELVETEEETVAYCNFCGANITALVEAELELCEQGE